MNPPRLCGGNCTHIGTTSRGTPVQLNSEALNADLRIAVGIIVPHPTAGYGGGAKIALPGVALLDTVKSNHSIGHGAAADRCLKKATGYGEIEQNPMRLDMDETRLIANSRTARFRTTSVVGLAIIRAGRGSLLPVVGLMVDHQAEAKTKKPCFMVWRGCNLTRLVLESSRGWRQNEARWRLVGHYETETQGSHHHRRIVRVRARFGHIVCQGGGQGRRC
ncbi:MAG: DUF2088 domain-containing protein [Chloroflexi bacterium]|nr:DUF2088 domain-containing protein [Chloroflexota bacterium]